MNINKENLIKYYRKLYDEDIERIACNEAERLRSEAVEVLKNEIKRRGLPLDLDNIQNAGNIHQSNHLKIQCLKCKSIYKVSKSKLPEKKVTAICKRCGNKITIFPLGIERSAAELNLTDIKRKNSLKSHSENTATNANKPKNLPSTSNSTPNLNNHDTTAEFPNGYEKHRLPKDHIPTQSIVCPNCQSRQQQGDTCIFCGIVFKKYSAKHKAVTKAIEALNKEDREKIRSEKFDKAKKCIERGYPIEALDNLGNILSLPEKLLFLSTKIDRHYVSNEIEAKMIEFIMSHDLYHIKVRLNQFAPKDEFLRLFTKNDVNVFFRISLGLLAWFAYLINPGRLFGGDFYNPYTNSVNIFSNHVGIALHELDHALDFRTRKHPGIYQLIRLIPFVALYQEYKASRYAIQFLKEKSYDKEEISSYRILYPAYSTYVFGSIYEIFPSPILIWFYLPVIIIGHVIGNMHAYFRNGAVSRGKTSESDKIKNTGEWIIVNVPETKSIFHSKTFFAMLLGFIIGFVISRFVGALIGALLAYYIVKEGIKYRKWKNGKFVSRRISTPELRKDIAIIRRDVNELKAKQEILK